MSSSEDSRQVVFGDSVVYSAVNLNLSVVFNYKDENGDVSVTKTVTPYDPLGKYVFIRTVIWTSNTSTLLKSGCLLQAKK